MEIRKIYRFQNLLEASGFKLFKFHRKASDHRQTSKGMKNFQNAQINDAKQIEHELNVR